MLVAGRRATPGENHLQNLLFENFGRVAAWTPVSWAQAHINLTTENSQAAKCADPQGVTDYLQRCLLAMA